MKIITLVLIAVLAIALASTVNVSGLDTTFQSVPPTPTPVPVGCNNLIYQVVSVSWESHDYGSWIEWTVSGDLFQSRLWYEYPWDWSWMRRLTGWMPNNGSNTVRFTKQNGQWQPGTYIVEIASMCGNPSRWFRLFTIP